MQLNKGFTIIELIVVIAIIATLSSIVIVNVSGYIKKSKDTAIKMEMSSLTKIALDYLIKHGNYGAFCNYGEMKIIYDSIAGVDKQDKFCNHSDEEWMVCVRLISDATKAWCIDSTGFSKEITFANKCKTGPKSCP